MNICIKILSSFWQLNEGYLQGDDDFESISSTNLIIKPTESTQHSQTSQAQTSISHMTKTIKPPPSKKHTSSSLLHHIKDRKDNSAVRRADRRKQEQSDLSSSASNGNELKHVFAKMQHKSLAHKIQAHVDQEREEESSTSSAFKSKPHYSVNFCVNSLYVKLIICNSTMECV